MVTYWPTRRLPTRGLVKLQTSQLVDATTNSSCKYAENN